MDDEVRVQVICVTYNQKDYIREALDSFLMQKTNFKYEVLVGDDCSTDGTSEIVAEYASKYPNIIKHIHRETNMGCLANFMDLCESATAKYVAFCDGDDYWTNENKLQIQYDFMEKNEDVNVCAHRVLLKGRNNKWGLYDYYSKLKEPFIAPQKKNIDLNKKITIEDISKEWLQMSTLFIRWKKIEYPDWVKEGTIGDITIQFLHLADKYIFIFEDLMSVYRQGIDSVFACSNNMDLHFIHTRYEYIRILSNTIQYFKSIYNVNDLPNLEGRLWTEIINYTNAIIKTDRWDLLFELKEKYPDVYQKCKGLLQEYNTRLKCINVFGLKRANMLRKKWVLKAIKPSLNIIYRVDKIYKQIHSVLKTIHSFWAYWLFALVPKKKNLWVFSGFLKKNYMDNTKYLYEYILENHPEIEAVWLTRSKEVRKNLKEKKMPVHRMNSPLGIWTMARASVAFSDHFKMSDYDNRYGFNARTKFVQLWRGVGLKDMRPRNGKIPNTTIQGVQLSNDILWDKKDGIFLKFIKLIKYIFKAPYRELFEKYFMIVCPGQQFMEYNAKPWHIPEKSQFLCGYPRNINLYLNKNICSTHKIIYAPTYRWLMNDEEKLVANFIKNVELINSFLEKYDYDFVLRLHPHTWRNYENILLSSLQNYKRFSISKEKDIYTELHNYSVMITDYSSIAYDFLLTKRPIVFLAFDYKDYCTGDNNFQMPYKDNCAGDVTYNWKDTIASIEKNICDEKYNAELRDKIANIFVPDEYNAENNSERIVNEIKSRIGEC